MHEHPRNRPRPGVHVLVRTPRREVDVPIMQPKRHVARRVCEIPTDEQALSMRVRGDGRDVEELARVVLYAGEEDERDLVGVLVDQGEDFGGGDGMVVVGGDEDH